ncbi:Der1-like family-domain-containing protein [Fimicolochytrium jonesii]|uniref:Der1-like family-domain-containing protein n=1 Tax=Fimicolochytrium jonesii TaxID=1396493 RepID=UPI0022FE1D46|nr:Der1-like family-domain-containing protein [Fimicolochytrium jonesii]KAI8818926.1 Der1-like family-domain-containing protein [Fimicolochytrium jonesii]
MPPPPATPSPLDEATRWYNSLPPVTRFLITGTVLFSLAAGLGLCRPGQLVFDGGFIVKRYQIWRLVTSFFWQPLGLNFLMQVYFLYRHSLELEQGLFVGRAGDYVFFMVFAFSIINVAAYVLDLVVLSEPLLLCVIYVWAMHHGEEMVSFLFGVRFKAMYLPWVLTLLDVLQGNPYPVAKLTGIAVGYLYYYLDQTYPLQNGGQRILVTPRILQEQFPSAAAAGGVGGAPVGGGHRVVPGAGAGPARTAGEGVTRRHVWGSGQRLGTD